MNHDGSEWLSTGQAAKHCSVKPDTILKWIKRGRLQAERTAGGHYRIQRHDLEPHILTPRAPAGPGPAGRPLGQPLRCWEYLGSGGDAAEECRSCIVYRARAAFCFQMVELARQLGHQQRFCQESCEECAYYQRVRGHAATVLVITPDDEQRVRLAREENESVRVRYAKDGYEASAVIQEFRPGFVVLDHALMREAESRLLDRLAEDRRVPGIRVVLAVSRGRAAGVKAAAKHPIVAGVIEKPLTVAAIASVVDAFPVEVGDLKEPERGSAQGADLRPL